MRVTRSIAVVALGGVLAVLSGVAPQHAWAHPLVDEGRRLYEEEADFVAALDVLGRAAAGSDLSADDLVDLFETRALVYLAMGRDEDMRADLRRLAAIRPDHALPSTTPPDVVAAFADLRASSPGAPRLTATIEPSALGVTITVRLDNDPAGLVREVRISGRAPGGDWERATGAPLFVATPSGGVVEYYAEAVGPGGAVIARSGEASAPLRAAPTAPIAAGGGGDEVWPWIVGGAGAAVVVAVVVTVVVLTTSGGGASGTDVSPFVVRF
ncbi:MAG: hypothetical protein U0234_14040 [Sandaracinus sp.]